MQTAAVAWWRDNFYSATSTGQTTDCAEILHVNAEDAPKTVKEKKLRKWGILAQHSDPISVLQWSDKKVTVILTYHDDEMRKVQQNGQKKEKTLFRF
jgi:hypothetical protein